MIRGLWYHLVCKVWLYKYPLFNDIIKMSRPVLRKVALVIEISLTESLV